MSNTTIDPDLRDQLLDLEHNGWKSLCDGSAAKFYGDLMTTNAMMVLANGATMTRAEVTTALAGAPPWLRYEITDVRLIAIDDATAALVYTGLGWREGADNPFIGAMTSVYHRSEDGWKLALYQQTAVSG